MAAAGVGAALDAPRGYRAAEVLAARLGHEPEPEPLRLAVLPVALPRVQHGEGRHTELPHERARLHRALRAVVLQLLQQRVHLVAGEAHVVHRHAVRAQGIEHGGQLVVP
jgi:hypothetical protein